VQETNVETSHITYASNEHETPAYLAQPEQGGPHPGVIVLQEWWGLVPHIEEVARRFAAEGFVALAPDLYHGEKAGEPDEARKLAMALDRERAVAEIRAAVHHLQQMEQVQPRQVGVVGWCMGGALALSTAADEEELGAVVAFYGRPLAEEDVGRIQAPVLGFYGSEDHGIPTGAVREFERRLEAHQIPHEIHIYDGAHHAFFNDTRAAYDAGAAEDAWKRTLAWFRQHLR
jgi:carboxymethylenebutenolidase